MTRKHIGIRAAVKAALKTLRNDGPTAHWANCSENPCLTVYQLRNLVNYAREQLIMEGANKRAEITTVHRKRK